MIPSIPVMAILHSLRFYELEIDLDNLQSIYAMRLICHGNHSGHDGNVNADLSQMTSDKKIVDRIIVEVKSPSAVIE
jgi:hypothetical protein